MVLCSIFTAILFLWFWFLCYWIIAMIDTYNHAQHLTARHPPLNTKIVIKNKNKYQHHDRCYSKSLSKFCNFKILNPGDLLKYGCLLILTNSVTWPIPFFLGIKCSNTENETAHPIAALSTVVLVLGSPPAFRGLFNSAEIVKSNIIIQMITTQIYWPAASSMNAVNKHKDTVHTDSGYNGFVIMTTNVSSKSEMGEKNLIDRLVIYNECLLNGISE